MQATYEQAVEWIASNDSNEWLNDPQVIIGSHLAAVAEHYGKTTKQARHDLMLAIKKERGMRWTYFQENETGDYLSIDAREVSADAETRIDARAAAIENSVSSVQGCVVTAAYLAHGCRPVDEADVPPKWRSALAWE